jgi:hypothetical protein
MGTDRDVRGRFLPGSPGGPGRPRRAVETDYLVALSEAVPLEKWREIVEPAVDQAVSGDAKAREWLGSYLAGKPTGHALRRMVIAEAEVAVEAVAVEPAASDAHEESAGPNGAGDALPGEALDMEANLSLAQRTALAALLCGDPVADVARSAGVTIGTVRRWLRSDPTFVAAHNVALSALEDRPRAALAALGDQAVDTLSEALQGYAEPGELKAAVETIKLLRLHEPGPARPTDPAAAERAILERAYVEGLDDLLTPVPPSWRIGDGDEDEDEDEDEEDP